MFVIYLMDEKREFSEAGLRKTAELIVKFLIVSVCLSFL
jgi:hypothetical protein